MDRTLLNELKKYIKKNYTGNEPLPFPKEVKKSLKSYTVNIFCEEESYDEIDVKCLSYSKEINTIDANDISSNLSSRHSLKDVTYKELFENISLDESFSEMILRKIDEKQITDVECYSKACIDRRHFSKIRSDKCYKPSKQTALALGIALELPLREMEDMLKKAGYALSDSSIADVVVKYYIENGQYDFSLIDSTLLYFDQKPLINY